MSIGGENRWQQEEDDDLVNQAAIEALNAQYQTDPGDPVVAAPPPPPPAPVAPAPVAGVDTFAQPAPAPWTPAPTPAPSYGYDAIVEGWTPSPPPAQPTYITDAQYFGSDRLDPNTGLLLPPAAPKLEDFVDTSVFGEFVSDTGVSNWFGTAEQQQQQVAWFQSELDNAVKSWDAIMPGKGVTGQVYHQQLLDEWERVQAAANSLEMQAAGLDAYDMALNQFRQQAGTYNAIGDPRGQGWMRQADPWVTPEYGFSTQTNAYAPDMEGQPYATGPNLMLRSDVLRLLEEQAAEAFRVQHAQQVGRGELGQLRDPLLPPSVDEEQFWQGLNAYQDWAQRQQLIGREQVAPSRFDLQNANLSQNPWERFHGTSDYGDTYNPLWMFSSGAQKFISGAKDVANTTIGMHAQYLGMGLDALNAIPGIGNVIGGQPQPRFDAQGRPTYTARSGGLGSLQEQIERIPGGALGWAGANLGIESLSVPANYMTNALFTEAARWEAIADNPGLLLYDTNFRNNQSVLLERGKELEADFRSDHPILYFGLQVVADPLNYIGVGAITGPTRAVANAKRARAATQTLKPLLEKGILTAADIDEYRTIATRLDINRVSNAAEVVRKAANLSPERHMILANGIDVDTLLSKKIVFESQMAAIRSGEVADFAAIYTRNVQELPALVRALGGTEADARMAAQTLGRRLTQSQPAAVTALTQGVNGVTPFTGGGVTLAAEVTPFPEAVVIQRAAQNYQRRVGEMFTPFDAPLRLHVDDYLARFPETPMGGYGTTAVGISRPVSEAQLRLLDDLASQQRVIPWNPLQELADDATKRTTEYVSYLIDNPPPTRRQLELARNLYREKKLSQINGTKIAQGQVTQEGAWDILAEASGTRISDLRRQGFSIPDPSDPSFDLKVATAIEEQAIRRAMRGQIENFLPRTEAHPSPNFKGFVRDVEGDVPGPRGGGVKTPRRKVDNTLVMTPSEVRDFFAKHAAEFRGTAFDGPIEKFAQATMYVSPTTGKMSSTTAAGLYQVAMRELLTLVEQGGTDMAHVRKLHDLLARHYNGSAVQEAMQGAQAAKRLESLPEARRVAVADSTEALKAQANELYARLVAAFNIEDVDESVALGQDIGRQLDEMAAKIRQTEPSWQPTEPTVLPDVAHEARAAQVDTLLDEADFLDGAYDDALGEKSTAQMLEEAGYTREEWLADQAQIERELQLSVDMSGMPAPGSPVHVSISEEVSRQIAARDRYAPGSKRYAAHDAQAKRLSDMVGQIEDYANEGMVENRDEAAKLYAEAKRIETNRRARNRYVPKKASLTKRSLPSKGFVPETAGADSATDVLSKAGATTAHPTADELTLKSWVDEGNRRRAALGTPPMEVQAAAGRMGIAWDGKAYTVDQYADVIRQYLSDPLRQRVIETPDQAIARLSENLEFAKERVLAFERDLRSGPLAGQLTAAGIEYRRVLDAAVVDAEAALARATRTAQQGMPVDIVGRPRPRPVAAGPTPEQMDAARMFLSRNPSRLREWTNLLNNDVKLTNLTGSARRSIENSGATLESIEAALREQMGRGASAVRRGIGDPGFDDPAAVMARMAREAVGESPLTEAAMHAIPNGGSARVVGYRGGRDAYAESKYGVIFTAREPQYGAGFASGKSMLDTPGAERGLSALEINARKVLNLTGLSPAERTARLRAALGDPNADFVQFVDPGMHGPEGIAAYRKQVAALRKQGYDLVISPEPMGGSISGTYAILDPAIARRKAYIHFGDDVQSAGSGAIAAGGGGLGFVHPMFRSRTPTPVVDFTTSMFAHHSPDQINAAGSRWQRYMDEHYDYRDMLKANAGEQDRYAVQLQTQVARTTDAAGSILRQMANGVLGEMGYVTRKGEIVSDTGGAITRDMLDDASAELKRRIGVLADPTTADEVIRNFHPWLMETKDGAESLRMLRRHGKEILSRWELFDPTSELGTLGPNVLPQTSRKRTFSSDDLKRLSDIMTGKITPRRATEMDRIRLGVFRQRYGDLWEREILPEIYDQAAGRFKADVHIDWLNGKLAGAGTPAPVDLDAMIERAMSHVAELEAKRIGFDWSKVPFDLKIMMHVKGNMAPFWMTLNPLYTINNVSGNLASMFIAALRTDMRVHPSLRRSARYNKLKQDIGLHPYLETQLVSQQTDLTDIPSLHGPAMRGSLASRGLDRFPVVGRYKRGVENINNAAERFFKEAVFGQEFDHRFAGTWRQEVERLPIERQMKDDLLGAMSTREVQLVLERHLGGQVSSVGNVTSATQSLRDQILARHRLALADANVRAYDATATVLRDYRMRNRLDGVLDRVFPVHYWVTKNIQFVGTTLAQRPGMAAAGMTAYDAWQERNAHLPPSLRTGYVALPVDWIPGVDTETYHFRVTNLMNPALFAIPKLVDPDKWNFDGTSLPDRLVNAGKQGALNVYNAIGYRIGPQFDVILKGLAAGSRAVADHTGYGNSVADFMRKAQIITMPTGYHSDLPFLDALTFGQLNRVQPYQRAKMAMNQYIDGAPYTRLESMAYFNRANEMRMNGDISQEEYDEAVRAMANNDYKNPLVKRIIDEEMSDRSNLYIVSKLGAAGRVYTDSWKAMYEANGEFSRIAKQSGNDQARMWAQTTEAHKRVQPWFTEYLRQQVSSGAMTQVDADAALKDVTTKGNFDNPIFQAAVEKANYLLDRSGTDIDVADEQMLRAFLTADTRFDQIVEDEGWAAAFNWMEQNAPDLPGYWLATDDADGRLRKLFNADVQAQKERDIADAKQYYDTLDAEANEKAPYYDRLRRAQDAFDRAVARADGNPYLLISAQRTRDDAEAAIYADAEDNGISLVGKGQLPREGRGYYEWRNSPVLDETGTGVIGHTTYPEEQRDHERGQAQRGHILDRVVETLGLQRWVDGKMNPDFVTDGQWDEAKYQAAVKEAAPRATSLYNDMAMGLLAVNPKFNLTTLSGRITAEDFIYHVRDKDAAINVLIDEMYKAIGEAQGMAPGPERDAAWAAIRETYGPYVKQYEDTSDGVTGYQHFRYDTGTELIRDWYYTLTPRQKREFEAQYPDAFAGDDGTFNPRSLTSEQVDSLVQGNNLEAKSQGSAEGPERLRRQMEADLPRVAQTERVYQLGDELDAALTPEQNAALDEIGNYIDRAPGLSDEQKALLFGLSGEEQDDATLADLAFYLKGTTGTEKYPDGTWRAAEEKAKELGLGELVLWIQGYRNLSGVAVDNGAYDARSTWFETLSSWDQDLLRSEDPKLWYPESGESAAPTSGGGGGTPAPTTGSGSGTYYGSGGSTYSGGGGFVPGGSGSNRRSGGGAGTDLLGNLYSFDPMLSSGQDDGRGDVVRQVADNLSQQLTAFGGLDDTMRNFIIMGLLNWIRQTLGDNPGMEQWAQVLARLQSPGQQPQRRIRGARPARDYGYAAD